MRDGKFWNNPDGELQQKITDFIKADPILSLLETKQTNSFKTTLVNFLETIKFMIYEEVEREFRREDLKDKIERDLKSNTINIFSLIPSEKINDIIQEWEHKLIASDRYCEAYWDELDDVLSIYRV